MKHSDLMHDRHLDDAGSHHRDLATATSTPALPLTSPGTKRKIFASKRMSGKSSMPALADQLLTDFLPQMNRKRSNVTSKASKSESQSELYYSGWRRRRCGGFCGKFAFGTTRLSHSAGRTEQRNHPNSALVKARSFSTTLSSSSSSTKMSPSSSSSNEQQPEFENIQHFI